MSDWTIILTAGAFALTLAGELLHLRRVRRVRHLAFGPGGAAAAWTQAVPLLRAVGAAALAFGLSSLMLDVKPRAHRLAAQGPDEWRHLVLVLDVSPSMRLEDAGPDAAQSRTGRARDVLDSIFGRVAIGQYKISIVATYTGAMPVVVDTSDSEVVRNVLSDLPMHFAFKSGETRLFDGLEEAARIAADWAPGSTTLIVASDGDTLPPTGMPKMPPSIGGVLVVGVGDPTKGSFINGRNSRQDVSALRQMALRLGGAYHDGNKRQVASEVLRSVTAEGDRDAVLKLGRREYALLAAALGAAILALLQPLLRALGSPWARRRTAWRDTGGLPTRS